jgi:ABC-type iron transport system FetAB ATPase subunit
VALGVALTQSLTFLGEVYGELMLLARGSVVAFGRIGVLVPGQPLASLGARRALSLSGLGPSAPPRPAISGSDALRELVAVTGPAGGGKSTLVRAMLGLVPASGEVRWNGRIVEDRGGWLVPPRLSWTPQSPRLFSGSVRENVLGVPDGIGQAGAVGSADAAEAARLNRAIWLAGLDVDLATGSLSLDARVGPRGLRLSGGQQQRVAAARMFATGAPVVVVDDVSSRWSGTAY